jgi:hypothetical protein
MQLVVSNGGVRKSFKKVSRKSRELAGGLEMMQTQIHEHEYEPIYLLLNRPWLSAHLLYAYVEGEDITTPANSIFQLFSFQDRIFKASPS